MPAHNVGNTETGRDARPETVRVWDPFVRIFHWSLVILFALAWMTEDLQSLHQPVGYTILGLLALRRLGICRLQACPVRRLHPHAPRHARLRPRSPLGQGLTLSWP
jgi:cytochrome b